MAEKGTSVHVTGNQGTAHSVYAIGIHQGTLNVNNCVDEERIRHLKEQTRKDITIWNRGMVRVSAIETVIEKLQTRHRWVTVTGNAGDGKTTLGYMTLKSLQDGGKEVFKINTPDDYFVVLRKTPDSVVFINDVLGVFDFDQRAFSTWLPVFQIILDRHNKVADGGSCPRIIFVSRLHVLEAARNQLGKYGDVILEEDAIVNPDKLNTDREKLDILNFHLSKHNISDIPESTKMQIYSQCPHGFPHCCEMYVELRASGHEIDIVNFFASPLKFLNYTTRVLIDKQECYDHFKILLKSDGQLDISSISDATLRTDMQNTVSRLLGSYLKMSGNGVAFSHPSIYESVAVAVGNKDPLFAAQEFPISVIMQKCKVHVPQEGEIEMCIFFKESSSAMDALVQRLAAEIRQGNYTVIQHELCWERKLCEQMINTSVSNTMFPFGQAWNRVSINRRDSTGRTLLHAAVRCRNCIAAKILLENGANANISPKQHVSPRGIFGCVLRSIADKDPYALFRFLTSGETVLHAACMNQDVDVDLLRLLIDHGADVSNANEDGETALHFLCQRENEDEGVYLGGWRGVNKTLSNITKRAFNSGLSDTETKIDTRFSRIDSLETLVDYLCEINGIDKAEQCSFQERQQGGAESILACLVRSIFKQDPDALARTQAYGHTVFHAACMNLDEDVNLLHLLIDHGTDRKEGKDDFALLGGWTFNTTSNSFSRPPSREQRYTETKNDTRFSRAVSWEALLYQDLMDARHKRLNVEYYVYQADSYETLVDYLCEKNGIDKEELEGTRRSFEEGQQGTETEEMKAITLLIQKGLDVNKADMFGQTALHLLCQRSRVDVRIVHLLLQNGAGANTADKEGNTPVHYICQRKAADISTLYLLTESSVDGTVHDKYGRTALHYLCERQRVRLAKKPDLT
ncbi:uncharacterized protein LOC124259531 [Haliotis rubra]|uniref:uncharacterized protein LOC124259531 n=1 Tax=Haliotis rubra TaxID=36100 RepID=UPI001EE52C7A|nr:uncharacterized protein LOC124259531 [Haliotis rubra]